MPDPKEPEYTLNLFHAIAQETNESGVAIVVQTTKVFVSFRYDILLDTDIHDRSITITIKGLHAPELLMPGSGPAIGEAHLTNLFGHYTLQVIKQDKTPNVFDIDIGASEVTILRSQKDPFVQVSTEDAPRA